MAGHEDDWMSLRIFGDLSETVDFDRGEESFEESFNDPGTNREPGRAHIGGDLTKNLLDLAFRFLRRAALGARADRHRGAYAGIGEHFEKHTPAWLERRALDSLHFAVEVDQDRAANFSRDSF